MLEKPPNLGSGPVIALLDENSDLRAKLAELEETQSSSIATKRGPEPALLNTPQVARYLCLSERTLETYRVRGKGPPYMKIGKGTAQSRVRYSKVAVDSWIAKMTEDT